LSLAASPAFGHVGHAHRAGHISAQPLAENALAPFRENTRIQTQTRDRAHINGTVIAYDTQGILFLDGDGNEDRALWSDFSAQFIESYYVRLIDGNDAQSHLFFAGVLLTMERGQAGGERLVRRAKSMDPELSDVADAMLENPGAMPGGDAAEPAGDDEARRARLPGGPGRPAVENAAAWPELDDAETEAATAELETFAEDAFARFQHEMGHRRTDRFTVYSDLNRQEGNYWVGLLDRMYDQLSDVFGIENGTNIWKGKCLLILFQDRSDFLQYSITAYRYNASGAAGYCYQLPTGETHIVMYRQEDTGFLAQVLVHEATHGFLFRYISSHRVPSWLHEGLAEYAAEMLVDQGYSQRRVAGAQRLVKSRGRLDNFLTARNIQGAHYGLAFDLTRMMIDENQSGYVDMIRGIKGGMTLGDAFEDEYGASLDRVIQFYATDRLGIDALRMD